MNTVFSKLTAASLLSGFLMLCLLCGCGSKQSPTGGKEDLEKLKLLASIPEEFADLKDLKVELTFDKPVDRASFLKGIYIYPPIQNKKVYYESNVITLRFLEALEKDTNYYITLTTRIKDMRGNPLETNQTLIFRNGVLQTNRISGNIEYEKAGDNGMPVLLNLLTADSVSVLAKSVTGNSYVIEALNPAAYIIRAHIDKNQNGRYDYGQEPYFETSVPQQTISSVLLQMVYADTVKPVIKSVKEISNREYEIILNKSISAFQKISLDDITHNRPIQIFAINHEADKINLLTASTDSAQIRFRINGLRDSKGNQTELSALTLQSGTGRDVIPPTVVSTYPRNGATVNDLQPVLNITFSEPIPATAFQANLKETDSNKEVSFQVIKSNSYTYKLQPGKPLLNYKSYVLTIGEGTSDISGNRLAKPYKLTFLPLLREASSNLPDK
jgi:hypothetical protein